MQKLVHDGGRFGGHDLLAGVIPVVQNDIAVVVLHVIIGVGLVVVAAVGKGAVGRCHLPYGDAVIHAAQGHGGHGLSVCFRQGGKVELFRKPFVAGLGSQILHKPGNRGVLRNHNGVIYIHVALIGPGDVLGPAHTVVPLFRALQRLIVEHRTIGDGAVFNAKGIGA